MFVGPQGHNLRAKLDNIFDFLLGENVRVAVCFPCFALHILLRLSKDKVYVSEQSISRFHFMRFSRRPKLPASFATYGFHFLKTCGNRSLWALTETHTYPWSRGIEVVLVTGPGSRQRLNISCMTRWFSNHGSVFGLCTPNYRSKGPEPTTLPVSFNSITSSGEVKGILTRTVSRQKRCSQQKS